MNWKMNVGNEHMPEKSKDTCKYITVNIQCSKSYFPETNLPDNFLFQVPSGTNYESVLLSAGIDIQNIGFISVNGVKREMDDIASENDNIRPLPLIICG